MDKIVFIFDTNAHSFIVDHPDYEKIIEKIQKQNNIILPHLSVVNVLEYINGIKSSSDLKRRQFYLRKIRQTDLGKALFLDPKTHILHAVGKVSFTKALEEQKDLIFIIDKFLRINDMNGFHGDFELATKSIFQRIKEIVKGYGALTERAKTFINENRERNRRDAYNVYFSSPPDDETYDMLTENILLRFGIQNDVSFKIKNDLFAKYPSLKYFIDVFWRYSCHLIKNRRKPKIGDYFDLEQILYLNIADYYVTRDSDLSKWIENCGNSNLIERVITPNDFIKLLDEHIIIKRAPQKAVSVSTPSP